METMGATAAIIVQAGVVEGQGGMSNLHRFRAHHPSTFRGGGDPLVADHWFYQIERVVEAMEITSTTIRISLAGFQLAGESLIWWDWVKTSRNVEAMTWVDFKELFMSKFFPVSVRHIKAREFLDLLQGDMTILEYVDRFTELARFADDHVATNLAKVRRFEDGLRLSIRGKIVGLLLQNMDSMVRTVMAIEGEIVDAKSIRDADTSKRKEGQPSSSSRRQQRTSVSRGSQGQGRGYQSQGQGQGYQGQCQGRSTSQTGRCFVSSASSLDI